MTDRPFNAGDARQPAAGKLREQALGLFDTKSSLMNQANNANESTVVEIDGRPFDQQKTNTCTTITSSSGDDIYAVFESDGKDGRGQCLYARYQSGASATRTSDGISIKLANGKTSTYRGGTIDSDGTAIYKEDGIKCERHLDGRTIKTLADGRKEITHPDGLTNIKTTISENETLTTSFKKGRAVEKREFAKPVSLSEKDFSRQGNSEIKSVTGITSLYYPNGLPSLESQTFDFSPTAPSITLDTNAGTLTFQPTSLTINNQDWSHQEYQFAGRVSLTDKDGTTFSMLGNNLKVIKGKDGDSFMLGEGEGNKFQPLAIMRPKSDTSTDKKTEQTGQEGQTKLKTKVDDLIARYDGTHNKGKYGDIEAETENRRFEIENELIRLGREALPALGTSRQNQTDPKTAALIDRVSSAIYKTPLPEAAIREMEVRSLAFSLDRNRPHDGTVTDTDRKRLEALIARTDKPLPEGVDQRALNRALNLPDPMWQGETGRMTQQLLEDELGNNARALYSSILSKSLDPNDRQKAVGILTELVKSDFSILQNSDFEKAVSSGAIHDDKFRNAVLEEGKKQGFLEIQIRRWLNSHANRR